MNVTDVLCLEQINANKRPSPEPLEVNAEATFVGSARMTAAQPPKKAKVTAQKKKKRRDPHEPQKSVTFPPNPIQPNLT